MKIGVVCVAYIDSNRHLDLMVDTLKTIKSKHDLNFYCIINKCRLQDREIIQSMFNFVVYNNVNCLSRAWNIGIRQAINDGCDFVFLPNMDIRMKEDCLDLMVDNFTHSIHMISANVTNPVVPYTLEVKMDTMFDNYSCFMIDKRVVEKVGYFDEGFVPAYYEDMDYQYRLELENLHHECCEGARYTHVRNASVNLADTESSVSTWSQNARAYFLDKWGGDRNQERFKTPFNK